MGLSPNTQDSHIIQLAFNRRILHLPPLERQIIQVHQTIEEYRIRAISQLSFGWPNIKHKDYWGFCVEILSDSVDEGCV